MSDEPKTVPESKKTWKGEPFYISLSRVYKPERSSMDLICVPGPTAVLLFKLHDGKIGRAMDELQRWMEPKHVAAVDGDDREWDIDAHLRVKLARRDSQLTIDKLDDVSTDVLRRALEEREKDTSIKAMPDLPADIKVNLLVDTGSAVEGREG